MSANKTAMGDIASSTETYPFEKDERYRSQQGLNGFAVKEPFLPNGLGLQVRKRKMVRKRKNVDESPFSVLCAWVVEHQIGLSLNLLLLLSLTHFFFSRARPYTSLFLGMSYYNPKSKKYTQGWEDMYFVATWIIIITGLRVAVMDYILKPIARYGGVNKPKAQVRFAEQGWLFCYYSLFSPLGMYIIYQTKYWFNLREIWTDFPTHTMNGLLKWYYLVQFAFWLQQIFVVNIEEKRKDYWQMFSHHIFTSALMFSSYGYYQTKVGVVILAIMDVVDLLLPLAKMLKYMNFRTACDITFGVFIAVWFVARHVIYMMVCWSMFSEIPHVMKQGCYNSTTGQMISEDGGTAVWWNVMQPFDRPGGTICYNNNIRIAFTALLMALQVLTLIWFGMILRVAYGVLSGKGAEDSRSDDEGEDEEYEEIEYYDDKIKSFDGTNEIVTRTIALPIEEDVNAEEMNLGLRRKSTSPTTASAPRRSTRRTGSARATALSIPGHSDKKDILGRIGCDKPS
ncbi:hypothetical protein BLS_004196 [Venturia inaequalis]|uniref:TLC domain-containing protein n=1 Tax=Venturia inaequalis TaxID=5025 RepID=A0A8H3V443_VENIN|nr:hypothetical protein BLS_004196 [Venturia inaequalis]KAE9977656.1 hypothetical protein EG328_001871 [Venturia inaequalis]KAE9981781.1 hypothetical protein EG327_006097 [Venturia inaequalis]RDI86938.1 hypothetical protein Vi05172_g3058 [Venturia inaequalis]